MRRALLALALAACAPAITTPSPSPTPPDRTPSATPSAAPPAVAFALAAVPAVEGSALTGVVAGGPGFVGVGFDGGTRAFVRLTPDGASWSEVDSPAFAGAVMIGASRAGGQIVAFGRDVSEIERDLAAAWLSPDGRAWRRVPTVPAFEGAQLVAAVPGAGGIVAVGGLPKQDRAAMWFSPDGASWERTAAFDNAFVWSVAAGGPGFVAAGWRRTPEIEAALWTSRDGRTWTAAPSVGLGRNFQIRAVAVVRGTLVAAGDGMNGEGAAVWTSIDGLAWTHAMTFGGSTIATLLPVASGVVAVGGRGDSAAAWTSVDGRTWHHVTGDQLSGAYMTAGATDGRRIVAVGATQFRIPGTGSHVRRAAAWWTAVR